MDEGSVVWHLFTLCVTVLIAFLFDVLLVQHYYTFMLCTVANNNDTGPVIFKCWK